ncbi:PRD domain-containing protein [Labedella phragmitis]|uniref:PRD domain-containing protein n=1 Tax=Labedella phragmitis TaxID=2498849 RepID=A0A444PSJ4_9MICO|nr:PRD domain-containing protein [Labedella phragmitis]RWZ50830.1 PRD domain-containing protein [Labedella phragmitis]
MIERKSVGPEAGAVHKVLNNNVLITMDPLGREQVLMGRGLAFQARPGDPVDLTKVEKSYTLDVDVNRTHIHEVLAAAPYEVIAAVNGAVDHAERSLGRDLGRHLPIAIIDHVQFLLERLRTGVDLPSASMPEVRVLYPDEFRAATEMSEHLADALALELPTDESVFLTMHVLNATRDEPNGTAALLFRRVQHVVKTVERSTGVSLDVESLDYARFILHVKFLLQRLVSESMLRSADTSFYDFARVKYPRAAACADEVKAYVLAATGSVLTDEELLYLIVHVERLIQRVSPD